MDQRRCEYQMVLRRANLGASCYSPMEKKMSAQSVIQMPHTPFAARIAALFTQRRTTAKLAPTLADLQAQRNNMAEMIWSHPEVFSGEHDVEFMMNMARSR
jgi:hypothetical protein